MKNNFLSKLKPTLKIVSRDQELVCTCVFVGKIPANIQKKLSNPGGEMQYSISFNKADKELVQRYKKAVEDGKIYTDPYIEKCGGMMHEGQYIKPFYLLSCEGFVISKYLNSELKKMGY